MISLLLAGALQFAAAPEPTVCKLQAAAGFVPAERRIDALAGAGKAAAKPH